MVGFAWHRLFPRTVLLVDRVDFEDQRVPVSAGDSRRGVVSEFLDDGVRSPVDLSLRDTSVCLWGIITPLRCCPNFLSTITIGGALSGLYRSDELEMQGKAGNLSSLKIGTRIMYF